MTRPAGSEADLPSPNPSLTPVCVCLQEFREKGIEVWKISRVQFVYDTSETSQFINAYNRECPAVQPVYSYYSTTVLQYLLSTFPLALIHVAFRWFKRFDSCRIYAVRPHVEPLQGLVQILHGASQKAFNMKNTCINTYNFIIIIILLVFIKIIIMKMWKNKTLH